MFGPSTLKQSVIKELQHDPKVDEAKIGVEIEDGIVVLSGRVSSWEERVAAEKAAHRATGTLDVANHIVVRSSLLSERSDADIAKAVRRALEWSDSLEDERIASTISGGTVELTGAVERESERDEAERVVLGVRGVRQVVNRIAVVPPAASPIEVKRAVEEALHRFAGREARQIGVMVEDGVATVIGRVHSAAERRAIIGAANGTSGVRRVEDRLEIED